MGGCQPCCCQSCLGCQIAQEATLVPLQRLGRFTEFMEPGFMCTDCCTTTGPIKTLKLRTTLAKYPQLRTKDNVFVTIDLAIQWRINGDPQLFPHIETDTDEHGEGGNQHKPNARTMTRDDLLYASIYRTQNPEQQIKDNAEQFFSNSSRRYRNGQFIQSWIVHYATMSTSSQFCYESLRIHHQESGD